MALLPDLHRLWAAPLNHGSSSGLYSYIPAIPFISAFFFWVKRRAILETAGYSPVAGIVTLALAGAVYLLGTRLSAGPIRENQLSWVMLSLVLWLNGSFILFYGYGVFKKALFSLGLLGFVIPIPSFILDPYIGFLQRFSADVSYIVFRVIGLPVFRKGMTFDLPGLSIEVARQCSGIRSSLALIIFTVLCGYIFLKKNRYRFLLLTSVIPIAVIKNGLRIVTLGLLGLYVDRAYITNHWLHRSGGVVFYVGGLLIMFLPLLWGLRALEKRGNDGKGPQGISAWTS